MEQTHKSRATFSPDTLFRYIMGVSKLDADLSSLIKKLDQENNNMQKEISKYLSEAHVLNSVRSSLNNMYAQVAEREIKLIDDSSWKKMLVLKAKDLFNEQADSLHYRADVSSESRPAWIYSRFSSELNMNSLLLDLVLRRFNSVKYQKSFRESTYDYLSEAFGEALFKVDCIQTMRNRSIKFNDVMNSPQVLLEIFISKVRKCVQDVITTPTNYVTRRFRTLQSSFLDLIEDPQQSMQKKNFCKEVLPLEQLFPVRHWFPTRTENLNKFSLESHHSNTNHQQALLILTEILNARQDLDRISGCEFLFTSKR